jgi:hypothetical protein
MIAIPRTFELGGRTWQVEYREEPEPGEPTTMGMCQSHEAMILLKEGMTPDETQHTFYHELCHAICYTLGWEKLNMDEDRIDALGGLIYQYLKRKKGRI